MKYERTKLIAMAKEKLAELTKSQAGGGEEMNQYHQALEAYKLKECANAKAYICAMKKWNVKKRDEMPRLMQGYTPNRPFTDNSSQVRRLEQHIKQLEMCAEDKIEIRENNRRCYDLFHDLFN